MLSLKLTYRGGGAFQTSTALDYDLAERDFGAGELLSAKVSRKRSVQQNEYFHAIIQAAFANQRGGPRLANWRHLKSHLLIKAGHCDETRVNLDGLHESKVKSVVGPLAAALKRQFDTVEVSYDPVRHEVILRFAKSWKFEKTDAAKAGEITNRVIEIICNEIVPGVSPDALLGMAREMAA